MKRCMFVLAIALSLSSVGMASIISYDNTQLFLPLNQTSTLTLPQFDPAWGFLTRITITSEVRATGTDTVTNNGATDRSLYNLSLTEYAAVTDPLANTVTTSAATIWVNAAPPFGVVFAPGQSTVYGPSTSPLGTNTLTYIGGTLTPAVLAQYVGVGNANFSLTSAGVWACTADTDIACSGVGTFNSKVSVLYEYNVPEPATAVILGLGLVILGGLRGRRWSKR